MFWMFASGILILVGVLINFMPMFIVGLFLAAIIILFAVVSMIEDYPRYIWKGCHRPFFQPLYLIKTWKLILSKDYIFWRKNMIVNTWWQQNIPFISKLGGISLEHHIKGQSFRFGIMPSEVENEFNIYPYIRREGKIMSFGSMATIKKDEAYCYVITINQHCKQCVMQVRSADNKTLIGEEFVMSILDKMPKYSYQLGVYYGGNETAPKRLKFKVYN